MCTGLRNVLCSPTRMLAPRVSLRRKYGERKIIRGDANAVETCPIISMGVQIGDGIPFFKDNVIQGGMDGSATNVLT